MLISAAIISIAYSGSYTIGVVGQSPTYDMQSPLYQLLYYSSVVLQVIVTISSVIVALSMALLAKLSPIGLVPEVPLLQVFESDSDGKFWVRMVIAGLTIVCLCSTLIEISLPLHRTVRNVT